MHYVMAWRSKPVAHHWTPPSKRGAEPSQTDAAYCTKGDDQIRTGVDGFAIRCLATQPHRQVDEGYYLQLGDTFQ